jgi:polysaccharide chain length determinant protein (PEP-CTERM system associated)
MSGPRLNTAQDYVALFVRRKWWIAVPFVAVSSLAALFAWVLPSAYVSETLILIQPRDVPADFVKELIAGTNEQRLSSIEQTVLSRTNLLKILNEFDANLKGLQGLNLDRKVERLRDRIVMSFEVERRRNVTLPVAYFRITFRDQDPALAQNIASRLASLFIELDNRVRETQVYGTREFMENELQKVADQLQQSTTKLRQLKETYGSGLPDQLETNLRTLDRLSMQQRSNAEALDRYVTLRLNVERQLSQTPAVIARESAESQGLVSKGNPLVDEYRKKERSYHELVAKYTSKHPDVERAKAELDRLRRDIPPQDLVEAEQASAVRTRESGALMVANPVHQSLTAQLREVRTEIDIREKERKWIDAEIARYNQRVQTTPRTEQEIAAVVRNNADLMKQHEDLKGKLSQAKLSESLESRQKGSQFVIVDPANYPLLPTKPNRSAIALVGLGIGLGLGALAALAVDLLNPKVWIQTDIENLLGVPVLVEIPEIVSAGDAAENIRRKKVEALIAAGATVLYAAGLYIVYSRQTFILRHLDPLVEKLMN